MRNYVVATPVVLAVWGGLPLFAGYVYTSFDYPSQTDTVLMAVNNQGQVAGFYGPLTSDQISFLTDLNGTPGPSFSVPGSPYIRSFTYATGIDDTGQVVGRFSAWPGTNIFLRSPTGTLTLLPMPDGIVQATSAAISGNGQILLSANNSLYFRHGDTYTAVVVPGAGRALNAANGMSIDNLGDVVGYYYPDLGTKQSFFRDAAGNYETVFFPGSVYTEARGLNNLGQAVGFYYTGATSSGFVWSGGNNFIALDYPGATSTFAMGINDSGDIVGFYRDAGNGAHGFFATPALPLPEPGSAAMALAGLSGLLIALRKRS